MNKGDLFRTHFHAQIPPGHHDGIRDGDDVVDDLHRFRLLDLGDDGDIQSCLFDEPLQLGDIFRGANKGKGDKVHPVFQSEREVLLVFLCEGGGGKLRTRQVDSLVGFQNSPMSDLANHLICPCFFDD